MTSITYIVYNTDIERELLKIDKGKLMKIFYQWIKIEEKQPSEIIILQNDDDLEIKGIFPLGECPIIPYVLLRKNNNNYSCSTQAFNEKRIEFLYLIFWQSYEEKNIFKSLINLLAENENSIDEFACKFFKLEAQDNKIIFIDTHTDIRFETYKKYELNKTFFIKLLIDIDNAIKKDAQEIIISLNDDGSYKVEASFEPIEEFPKYRCYP